MVSRQAANWQIPSYIIVCSVYTLKFFLIDILFESLFQILLTISFYVVVCRVCKNVYFVKFFKRYLIRMFVLNCIDHFCLCNRLKIFFFESYYFWVISIDCDMLFLHNSFVKTISLLKVSFTHFTYFWRIHFK